MGYRSKRQAGELPQPPKGIKEARRNLGDLHVAEFSGGRPRNIRAPHRPELVKDVVNRRFEVEAPDALVNGRADRVYEEFPDHVRRGLRVEKFRVFKGSLFQFFLGDA